MTIIANTHDSMMGAKCLPDQFLTGFDVRAAAKANTITLTSGLAASFLQANLIVLPSRYAHDFRLLCQRNPVPCPLIAESSCTGSYDSLKSYLPGITGEKLAAAIDIRHDAPRYMVYENGKLINSHACDVSRQWSSDHVAFLIGCSYSFETALISQELPPRQYIKARNVPMYRTNIPLCSAGVFRSSTYVVSMRPYKLAEIETVRDVTRPFTLTHGEPVGWGWDAVRALGIEDINKPDWGDAPVTLDDKPLVVDDEDNVPVFWGCGVTPQEAVMCAKLDGTVLGHAPGHMILLDVRDDQVFDMPKKA